MKMNRFDDFFRNMTDEEWEKFSVKVLQQMGFIPITLPAYGIDSGKDFLFERQNIRYIVSCNGYHSPYDELRMETKQPLRMGAESQPYSYF